MDQRKVVDARGRRWSVRFHRLPNGELVGLCRRINGGELIPEVRLPSRSDWPTVPDERLAQEILLAEADQR
jgi:hypothetical protein